jgi:SAM-dependent methyltransferase
LSERCSEVLAEAHQVVAHLLSQIPVPEPGMLLDVGCWDGSATAVYAKTLGCQAHGIEVNRDQAARAQSLGIHVTELDLESSLFPWPANTMGVVVANQVFEHLKNIWLPMSEVFRVLRPGGHLVISVPNLASLHNRIMLALGHQPSSIRTFGPHVRGFTLRDMKRFVTLEGAFAIRTVVGVGFYPLGTRSAKPLARIWPSASHTLVLVAQKSLSVKQPPWLANLDLQRAAGLQTHY